MIQQTILCLNATALVRIMHNLIERQQRMDCPFFCLAVKHIVAMKNSIACRIPTGGPEKIVDF